MMHGKQIERVVAALLCTLLWGCGGGGGSSSGGSHTQPPPETCDMPSNPNPVFSHHLTDLSLHSTIHPMGAAWAGAIHENGHTYLQIAEAGVSVPVYAPVDSRLERVFKEDTEAGEDWSLTFRVSCEVWYKLAHITHPIDEIRAFWSGPGASHSSQLRWLDTPVPFAAGDYLGSTIGTLQASNWDFGVYNRTHINDFINPDRFYHPVLINEYSGALNSVCPYDYYTEELAAEYRAMFGNLLLHQPVPGTDCRSGSRDLRGTIAGTWWRSSGDPVFYHEVAGIGDKPGGWVILGGIGPAPNPRVMLTADLSPRDPATVTDEHCYDTGTEQVYFQLESDLRMRVAYRQGGICEDAFPDSDYAVYDR